MCHLHLQNVKMVYLDISGPHVCSFPSALILYFEDFDSAGVQMLQLSQGCSHHCRKSSGDCGWGERDCWTVLEGTFLSQTNLCTNLILPVRSVESALEDHFSMYKIYRKGEGVLRSRYWCPWKLPGFSHWMSLDSGTYWYWGSSITSKWRLLVVPRAES